MWPTSPRNIALLVGWTSLVFLTGAGLFSRQSCAQPDLPAVHEKAPANKMQKAPASNFQAVSVVRPDPSFCLSMQGPSTLEELSARAESLAWGYPDNLKRYIRFLGLTLTGTLTPHANNDHQNPAAPLSPMRRWCGEDWPINGYTMAGLERLKNVAQLILDVISNKVPGGFAELGVWRGGTCLFAKLLLDAMGEDRAVHVFDAFAKISSYGEASQDILSVKEEDIHTWFRAYGAHAHNVYIYKGFFLDTLPAFRNNPNNAGTKIAILRVDANHHDSYQDALYDMYSFVPVGGYVIFDDVETHPNAMLAWKEFKEDQGLTETLQRIDRHSAFFKKTREISIDYSKKRPAIDVNVRP